MAISYATSAFNFVDSQYGTGSASNIKSLVNVAVDRKYHKEVQKKTWFRKHGMIGPDTYTEGTQLETAAGYPVILKQELKSQPGDTIQMGERKNLSADVKSVGVVGQVQLVDSEKGMDFNHKQVKVEQFREGVMTRGGMNEQRNPYEPLEQTEISLLSDFSSQIEDSSLLYTQHYGYAPHLFRQYGVSNLVPVANPNTLYGNDETMDTTLTIASITGAGDDNIKGKTFELGYAYAQQNDFDFVSVAGDKFLVALISPWAKFKLGRDEEFRNAQMYAQQRGISNPLFKGAEFVYGNVLVFTYDKIRSILAGKNPGGLTVTSEGAAGSTLVEADYTSIGGGVAAAKLHHTIFLGANALGLAEGPMKMGKRVEDDYQTIIGRDVDMIFGSARLDWINEAATTKTNQSALTIVNTLI